MRGLFPFRFWLPGMRMKEARQLALPDKLEEGDYLVAVGVYDRVSEAREPARDQRQVALPDNAVPLGRFRLGGG